MSFILFISTFLLSSCDRNEQNPNLNQTTDADSQIAQVNSNTVVLNADDIISTEAERYQPSYNLYGLLVPVEEQQMVASGNGYVDDIFVEEGNWVVMGTPLLRLRLSNPLTDVNSVTSKDDSTSEDGSTSEDDSFLADDSVSDDSIANSDTESDHNTDRGNQSNNQINNDNDINSVFVNNSAIEASQFITLNAPYDGEITHIQVSANTKVEVNQPLLTIADTRHLQLIGELPLFTDTASDNGEPIDTETQLSVGQSVNFTVVDTHQQFVGQISDTKPNVDGDMLTVQALVIQSEDTKNTLEEGMQATMQVDYGQIQTGVRIPYRGIHDVDLSSLDAKHTRPVRPLQGYVWVIGQDERLLRQPVTVVEFFPETEAKAFLVTGINNSSLVSLADLPPSAEGALVKIE